MSVMPEEINTISINIAEDKFKSPTKHKKVAVVAVVLFLLIITGISLLYAFYKPGSYINPLETNQNNSEKDKASAQGSQYENPINGRLIPNSEADEFKNKKPIAVMLNNYVDARPSAGISYADIVYEAVAEGGITRLMPIFYSRIPEKVRSIRSARYYFAQLAAPYHPHFIHWGAAHVPPCQKAPVSSPAYCPPVGGKVETIPEVDAYDQIVKLGLPNLDGGNYSCDAASCAFGRDPEKLGKLALEHTAFVRTPLLYDLAKKIRVEDAWHQFTPFTTWKFKDDAAETERGTVGTEPGITYNYWTTMPGFNVKWIYDPVKNEYIRYQNNIKIIDDLNQEEIRAKNIIIRFTTETSAGDKKSHLIQGIVGKGKARIFMDGKSIEATWERATTESMDVYKTLTGEDITFNRGQIWVQLLPVDNEVLPL